MKYHTLLLLLSFNIAFLNVIDKSFLTDYTINVTASSSANYTLSGTDFNGTVSGNATTPSDTWKFYLAGDGVVNYAPFPADLKAPASGSTVTLSEGKATFTWEGTDPVSGDTLSYTVYVDTVDGKQDPASALTDLSAQTADVELEAATTYYWRVKTSDGTNASYSIVYSFKTQ